MKSTVTIIDVTDRIGTIIETEWLNKSESVHRELRPHLPKNYTDKMRRVFAMGGRMCLGIVDESVKGVAVYRIHENTADGVHMYVDDLITSENSRSSGVGAALLDHLQKIARRETCENFTLDSGTWRQQAHKFYFREGLVIAGFHFAKVLKKNE